MVAVWLAVGERSAISLARTWSHARVDLAERVVGLADWHAGGTYALLHLWKYPAAEPGAGGFVGDSAVTNFDRRALENNEHPNLRPLILVGDIDEPIIMSERPRHTWSYLRKKGIWL